MNKFESIVNELLQESFLKADKRDPKDLETFVTKRSAGAKKIAAAAEKKGGYSELTAIHFKAKETPYKEAAKHTEDKDSKFLERKADECFERLKDWKSMSQREFQAVMGRLEAYGECFIRSEEAKISISN